MKKKHFNIPIFIPELACPFQCIYCNQQKISGFNHLPDKIEVITTIQKYLSTISEKDTEVQLAYFGGNFTGIPLDEQEKYLQWIQPYIESGRISGIRLSTRPDYINENVLDLLARYKVQSIELGAQSMDDEVLRKSKRGHTASDTEKASHLVKSYGFSLGLQMMIGLPGDSLESAIKTAHEIVRLGAADTRIYPTLVIKDTVMEQMYHDGRFIPLSLDEAVKWSAELFTIFDTAQINVLKLGLHPSEGLLSGADLVAGPFHRSFRELVLTEVWREKFESIIGNTNESIVIHVPEGQLNAAVGYEAKNRKWLEERFKEVSFKSSGKLKNRDFEIISLPT